MSPHTIRALAVAALLSLPLACRRHAPDLPADLGQTAPLNEAGGAPAPEEAYALYSSLYRMTTNEPLAFAAYSVTDIPQVDGMCLKPSTDEDRQMTDAFQSGNRQSHPWQAKFKLPQAYQLLTTDQVNAALRCIQQHGESTGCGRYRGLRVVRFLGLPAFNGSHSRALVSVIKSCGSDCGSGGIFVARKTPAGWEHEPPSDFTRDCSWAY